jgi:hypothetical protein
MSNNRPEQWSGHPIVVAFVVPRLTGTRLDILTKGAYSFSLSLFSAESNEHVALADIHGLERMEP